MSTKCEYYVDMGEHNKPLCKKRNYRPSDCESCPTYIKRLQEENAKLRKLVQALAYCVRDDADCDRCVMNDSPYEPFGREPTEKCDGLHDELVELGVEP